LPEKPHLPTVRRWKNLVKLKFPVIWGLRESAPLKINAN
jgi:hypothetical protein